MQAVKLPAGEPAWLLVRPELWAQISGFVEWVQERHMPEKAPGIPAPVALAPEVERQVDELLNDALADMAEHGLRAAALMHISGRLVAWKGHDSYEDTLRMGLAAVKDHLLNQYLAALLEVEGGPYFHINIPFERDTTFDPASAAGAHIQSTSEAVVRDQWMLVAGFGESDRRDEAWERLNQLRQELHALLPETVMKLSGGRD
jgi:hypothetical protein